MGRLNVTGTSTYSRKKRSAAKPLLPGDVGLLNDIARQKEARKEAQRKFDEPLEVTGSLRSFTPLVKMPNLRKEGSQGINVCECIDSILKCMWQEIPTNLPNRLKAEVFEFRKECPPVATLSQLYGVFPNSTTLVDKAVSRERLSGQVRFVPVASSKEGVDLILRAETFLEECKIVDEKFAELCRQKPDATFFDIEELKQHGVSIDKCVSGGVLVLDVRKSGNTYSLGVPRQGLFLRLVRQSCEWILANLKQGNPKFKELPESELKRRLQTPKKHWSQLRGVTLEWMLYAAIGEGLVTGFETPVGRGWKSLR